MALKSYEVDRNWQVRAETPLAAVLRIVIEEGGDDRYSYSVLDIQAGLVRKVTLGREPDLEVTVCRVLALPKGKFARLRRSDQVMEGTPVRWLVVPSITGQIVMMSLAEAFRDRDRAIRRAKKMGTLIRAARAPVFR